MIFIYDNEKDIVKRKNFFLSFKTSNKNFANHIVDYCIKNNINNIIAYADEECQILRQYIDKNNLNINLCTPNLNTIKLLNHKFKLLENFKNNDFVPVFYIINSQKSLSNAIKKLDYPNKKIILKPVSSRGSRGIILLNSKSSLSQTFYNNDKFIELNLKELNLIKNTLFKTKNTFLAMHYLKALILILMHYIQMES